MASEIDWDGLHVLSLYHFSLFFARSSYSMTLCTHNLYTYIAFVGNVLHLCVNVRCVSVLWTIGYLVQLLSVCDR